jgi:hypothetical protein
VSDKRAQLAALLAQRRDIGPAGTYQTAMALHQLFVPDSVVNNMRSTVRFLGPLDEDALRQSLQAIVDRHPALRTVYQLAGSKLVQKAKPAAEVAFDVVDASAWSVEAFRQRLIEDVNRPFDVSDGPVFRARLYRRRPDDAILQVEVHHSVCDLWSLEIVLAEVESRPVGPPPATYIDYVTWETAWLRSASGKAAEAWWHNTLDGAVPTALPGSDPEAPASHLLWSVPSPRLTEFARRQGVTVFTVVLSVLQAALARLLDRTDVSIASPTANRPAARFERSVGFFANPVTYRQRLEEGTSWSDLLARNRRYLGEALDHGSFPVSRVSPSFGETALPQTDVVFMFQQYQEAHWTDETVVDREFLGLRSAGLARGPGGLREVVFIERASTVAPLMFEVIELKRCLQIVVCYRSGCLSSAQVQGLVKGFLFTLDRAVRHPEENVV